MGGVPKPILLIVWVCLGLAASTGFILGITQSDHKAGAAADAPIAANLPADVVIKDAQPLAAPPPPPPPKAKAAAQDNSDEPDESDLAPVPVEPSHGARDETPDEGPLPIPAPQAPAGSPDNLPPT